jgi:hypothetical protein
MDAYKEYEKNCEKIRASNDRLLTDFEIWLVSLRLAPKTIVQHIANIDFFINDYLLYEDAIEAIEGVHKASMYVGDWFIRKAMWASPSRIRSNAASMKKFYAFMLTKGLVDEQALNILAQTIKEEMPTWLAQLNRHNQDALEMDDGY